jgi:hypothetical protein
MARKNCKGGIKGSWLLIILLFCLPMPAMPDTSSFYGSTIPLDQGAFIYILIDLRTMRPVINTLPVRELKSWQAIFVLDSTEIAAAALFNRETGRRFQLVGWGRYPSFTSSIALFLHKNWKWLYAETGSYWFSDVDRVSVRITSKQIYTLAWRGERTSPVPVSNSVEVPDELINFRKQSGEFAPLSLWMENPGSMLNQMLAREKIRINIPSDRLYLNLYPMEGNLYKAEFRLQFRSDVQAWNLASTLSAINAFPLSVSASFLGSLLFFEPPFVNGRNLDFKSDYLTEEEIALLMKMFVAQWR